MLFILFLQHEKHIEHIIYMNLPSDFVTRTRSLMGEEQFEKLAEALQHDTPVSIRLNRNKCKSVPAESCNLGKSAYLFLENFPLQSSDFGKSCLHQNHHPQLHPPKSF